MIRTHEAKMASGAGFLTLNRRLGLRAAPWVTGLRSALNRFSGLFRGKYVIAFLLFLPTTLTMGYFFFVAADQFESEARFVVRSASKPEVPGSFAVLVQLGLGRSQDDSFIVQDFLRSRDAVALLRLKLPLLEMYGRKEADFLARYPSLFFGHTEEEFYRYLKHMISVEHSDKTGISTLRVRAFEPKDAQMVELTLLDMAEDLINRINRRLQIDAVGSSVAELKSSQTRLIDAQTALTEFRNRELMLDPAKNAVALAELIAKMSVELAGTKAQISELMSGAKASPQLVGLRRKAAALEDQIARERARISTDSGGLADRIAAYERLSLEREFANKMLTADESELVRTRAEATRQLPYLERLVEPNLSDYSNQPKRLRSVMTVFAANALLLLIGWLIVSGVREHASAR